MSKSPFCNTKQILIAFQVAEIAHRGQFRRDGVTPYLTHPLAVAWAVETRYTAVALLHDVLEDSTFTPNDLIAAGVHKDVLVPVIQLTKCAGQDYDEYIRELKRNPAARAVKIADITHNLASNPKAANIEKYERALRFLKSRL